MSRQNRLTVENAYKRQPTFKPRKAYGGGWRKSCLLPSSVPSSKQLDFSYHISPRRLQIAKQNTLKTSHECAGQMAEPLRALAGVAEN